jgi:hypothetical protein
MNQIRVATTLAILLLVPLAKAQQASTTASTNSEKQNAAALPPGPILGGMGTTNYIPIWASSSFLLNSVMYQTSYGSLGIGTTTPVAKLDVNGSINTPAGYSNGGYEIGGNKVLSIGYAGNRNIFLGVAAGVNSQDQGTDNTFAGYQAGYNNFYANGNTFIGSGAGRNSSGSGSNNTYIGMDAGLSSAGDFAENNTLVGASAGANNQTGGHNVFLGTSAGYQNILGSVNTFLGQSAGYYNTSGNNNIYIGNLGPQSGTESSTIRIGGDTGQGYGTQTAAFVAGIYGTASSSGILVYVNSTGQLGTQTSSLRFKEQVRDMGDTTDALMRLRPVTFFYKPEYSNGERTLQYGLIAEEVAQVYPELVAYDNDGQPYTVRYQYLSTMLLNEVQKQYRRTKQQSEIVATQQVEIKSQRQEIAVQQQEIESLRQQLQLQNATLQEGLSRLEKLVNWQTQTVAWK